LGTDSTHCRTDGYEIQPSKPKYASLNPLSQAPFFTLSVLTELLPRSSDLIMSQKLAHCGPIHNLKIHRHKPAQGESKTLTQVFNSDDLIAVGRTFIGHGYQSDLNPGLLCHFWQGFYIT
jgi:hypothetical protein